MQSNLTSLFYASRRRFWFERPRYTGKHPVSPCFVENFQETISTGLFGRTRLVKTLRDKKFYQLKIMKKAKIVKLQQLQHVQNEVRILSRVRSSYVVDLKAVFQDENSLYMLFEYLPGGELYSHLRKNTKFTLPVTQFYTVETACAINYLHKLKIAFRDLKPENIAISREGHIKLTEFSLATIVNDRTFTLCGTPEYVAPEVIESNGYGTTVDWWALGVLVYEMCVGHPPFYGKNPFTIYKKILEGKVEFPHDSSITKPLRALISQLLQVERRNRLGCSASGFEDLKHHAFFKGVDWNSAIQQLMVPPVLPLVVTDGDTSNYDYYLEETTEEHINLNAEERKMFQGFDEILERPKQA